MYYIFLFKSLILFFINLIFFVLISQVSNLIKIKLRKLNLIIIIFFIFPILLSVIGLSFSLTDVETLFTFLIINFAFVIIYPGLDYENIPSLKILSIIKKYEEKYKKPCPKVTIKNKLKPNLIILKRITELKKDKFLNKNSIKLNLIGKIFVIFFLIIRTIYKDNGAYIKNTYMCDYNSNNSYKIYFQKYFISKNYNKFDFNYRTIYFFAFD